MPLDKYFAGNGEKVMRDMMRRYGAKKGKEVFYASVQKRKRKKAHRGEALKRMRG